MEYQKLIEMIMEYNDGLLTRKEALSKGIPSATFSKIVKRDGYMKIAPGEYAKDSYIKDDLYLLQKRYPHIVFSGLTALSLYDLSDRIPDAIEFSLSKGHRVRKESIKGSLSYHIENNIDFFNFANVNVSTQFGNSVICYSKEKVIVEMIRKRDEYPSETFIKAIKIFLKSDDKDQALLFQCAKMRNVEKKVFETMELLGYGN